MNPSKLAYMSGVNHVQYVSQAQASHIRVDEVGSAAHLVELLADCMSRLLYLKHYFEIYFFAFHLYVLHVTHQLNLLSVGVRDL